MQSISNSTKEAALWFRQYISQERLKNKYEAWPQYQSTLQKRGVPLMLLKVASSVGFFILQQPNLEKKSNANDDGDLMWYLLTSVMVFRIFMFGLSCKFPRVVKVFHVYETIALGCM